MLDLPDQQGSQDQLDLAAQLVQRVRLAPPDRPEAVVVPVRLVLLANKVSQARMALMVWTAQRAILAVLEPLVRWEILVCQEIQAYKDPVGFPVHRDQRE